MKIAALSGQRNAFSALSLINRRIVGYIAKPSRAKRIAASATSPNDIVPHFSSAVIQASGAAGTIASRILPAASFPPWCR